MNHPSTPQPAATKDRVIRVFVSSTFRDMIEDHNELMSQVWPALRRLCRGRAVEFVGVDLRWGVTEDHGYAWPWDKPSRIGGGWEAEKHSP